LRELQQQLEQMAIQGAALSANTTTGPNRNTLPNNRGAATPRQLLAVSANKDSFRQLGDQVKIA